jgi:hypothetical protein
MFQRNCQKHVEFFSKNKYEKLVHLIGFIIRIYHDARSSECQNNASGSCMVWCFSYNEDKYVEVVCIIQLCC